MMCDNLILYYNPDEGKICTTDLTLLSTGAIKRSIVQTNYILYNNDGKYNGNVNIINNICIYTSTPNDTNIIGTYCFTINIDTFIEKYSAVDERDEVRNSSGQVNQNSVRFLNLTSVEGNQTYTKLKWILPVDEQGKPLTRTLVFYN